ncbi:MAG: lactonase family protein [Acidobacteria bacterium]|nr:MAG: lactonase family protein [Acidobacteriota bacterium]
MSSEEFQSGHGPLSKTSRRKFLKHTAALAMAGSALACAPQSEVKESEQPKPSGKPRLVCVGTYSSPAGPEGSPGQGQGVYLFEMDPATGALTQREVLGNPRNPSWLALSPDKKHLYSGDEIHDFQGKRSGAVSSYSVDISTGHLTLLNTVSSEGDGPAHISVHPSGRYVFVANYGGGTIAVVPILSNGELGPATDVHQDKGPLGPLQAASAPKGSFAISGHDAPHAHMIESDPSGKRVLSTDLGMDKILVWNFDVEKGKLTPNAPPSASAPPGDGPRHFVFHPNGRWFYCIQEEGSSVVVYDYEDSNGSLTQKQIISTLPKGFVGTNFTSEIRISSDGKFVYGANRLHDSIAWFSVDGDGKLSFAGEEWTRGDYPRSFTIDPAGDFLYCCNQRADAITTFRVNKQTGALTFTGQYTPVGTPANVVFLT